MPIHRATVFQPPPPVMFFSLLRHLRPAEQPHLFASDSPDDLIAYPKLEERPSCDDILRDASASYAREGDEGFGGEYGRCGAMECH